MAQNCSLIFHALADKTRLAIIKSLAKKEMCVTDICAQFDISQPSISHHLDILKRAGLVTYDKRGREVYYKFSSQIMIECCGKEFSPLNIVIKEK